MAQESLEEMGIVVNLRSHQRCIRVTKAMQDKFPASRIHLWNPSTAQRRVEITCSIMSHGENERVKLRSSRDLFAKQTEHVSWDRDRRSAANPLA